MTGRLLEALRLVPPALWRHLGTQFDIEAPDLDPEQTKSTINGTFSGHRAPESDDRRQEGPRTTLTVYAHEGHTTVYDTSADGGTSISPLAM